jgi:hypothetical protein
MIIKLHKNKISNFFTFILTTSFHAIEWNCRTLLNQGYAMLNYILYLYVQLLYLLLLDLTPCITMLIAWQEGVDTTLCNKVGLWLSGGRWFSTNKTDRHHIAEILLKVALNNYQANKQSINFLSINKWYLRHLAVFRGKSCT